MTIPDEYRKSIIMTEDELAQEIIWATDAYCDELFDVGLGECIIAGYSRLVCDVERFRNDDLEPCAKAGNGVFYTHTVRGKRIRYENVDLKNKVLRDIYDKHHERLAILVNKMLEENEFCLIIDGHSFPNDPILGDDLPDFCIGTEDFHTPDILIDVAMKVIESAGYSVEINRPFSGSIVSSEHYKVDKRVMSVMIEVNKKLYLEDGTLIRSKEFERIKAVCGRVVKALAEAVV